MANERELKAIEDGIRKLRIEYDLYAQGQRRRPPVEERRQIEFLVRQLGGGAIHDNAERFRYNNLVVKYNLYSEIWERQLREREEGPLDYRKRKAALSRPAPPPPPPPAPSPGDAKGRSTVNIVVGQEAPDQVQRVFESYLSARESTGEGITALSFEKFQKLIQDQASAISRKTGSASVDFEVKVADGKAKLVARPKGKNA